MTLPDGIGGTDDCLAHPTPDNILERRKAAIGRMVQDQGMTDPRTQAYITTQIAYGVLELAEQLRRHNDMLHEIMMHWRPW